MEKIARDKLAVKIICVALAVILWMYVSYQENPSMTKTVKNVPLAISGEQALKENGFSVYSISEKSVDVKVTAKRLSLVRLSNRTLSAVINVSSIKKSGTYVLPVAINSATDSNASYYVKGKDIKVVIEPIKTNEYSIEANVDSSSDASVILKSYELNTKEISVSAPESILKEIGSIRTETIVADKNEKEQTAKVIVYGKNGKVLEGVECTPSEVKITCSFYDVKTVPIVLKTSEGKTFSLPTENTVAIYGKSDILDKITQIETTEVNLTVFEENTRMKLQLVIPEGIKAVDNVQDVVVILEPEFFE